MQPQLTGGMVISPMSIGEVVDAGFNVVRRHFRYLATIGAWGMAVGLLAITLLSIGAGDPSSPMGALNATVRAALGGLAAAMASLAIAVACARLVDPAGAIDQLTPAAAYGVALRRVPALFVLSLLIGIATIPLAIVLPLGIYIWVRWSLAWYGVLIERLGPIAALRRSWQLTRRKWWHTAIALVLTSLVVSIIQLVLQAVFELAIAGVTFALNSVFVTAVLHGLAAAVLACVLMPFSAAVFTVLYFELRARAEGLDLERRMLLALPPE